MSNRLADRRRLDALPAAVRLVDPAAIAAVGGGDDTSVTDVSLHGRFEFNAEFSLLWFRGIEYADVVKDSASPQQVMLTELPSSPAR